MATYWPLILVVASSVLYTIASKEVPHDGSPYVTLVITYLLAAISSFILYCMFDGEKSFPREALKVFAPGIALGISMIGLEIGYIFIYRANWKISIASLLCNAILAVALLLIGLLFYRERLNLQQALGFILCLAGSVLLVSAKN